LKDIAMGDDAYVGKWVHPESDAPLAMVGRIGNHDLDWLGNYVISLLGVDPSDEVLDVCCGNGLLTVRVARVAREVTGVDFSKALLLQAQNISAADNVTYLEGDARDLATLLPPQKFDKALMTAGFQYFDMQAGCEVLSGLHKVLKPGGRVAILEVPDRAHKIAHLFRALQRVLIPLNSEDLQRFPTITSRITYLKRNIARAFGIRHDSEMGQWWSRAAFHELAIRCGFECSILDKTLEETTHSHRSYRFDAVLRPL
jgi:ubiquinone/menaquinone biosynthesis C-methylase UbiE